jgi:signal transduction histidine kinase/ligand-binding sensor domain-containing protein/CheY-like chemotaxis protein/AraC-like DNA-binding protein
MVWIGTNKGLFSYDGYMPQPHFTFGERNNSRIYCAVTADGERLYLGSDNGLLIYNCRTDRYEEPEIPFPTDIRALVRQGDKLWIGTLNGLYVYRERTLRKIDRKACPGLPHETVYAIVHTSDDLIYVGTYNGLCRYSTASDTFTTIPLPPQAQRSNRFVNSLLEDRARNCIWIGTEGNLFKYTPATGDMERIETFCENSVKALALDQHLNLLAGTDNGLYVYRPDGTLRHIVHDSRNILSLADNIIWSIFTDREKNIWLGTDHGISLSRFNSDFQYIPIAQVTGTGDGNHFHVLRKDSRGNYWFGGTNGLIRFNERSNRRQEAVWYKMGDRRHPLRHNRLRDIYEDKDRRLWIAGDGGVNRYDYATQQFVHYNIVDSAGMYNCNWAYNLFEDNDGRLWIGTCLGGVFVADKKKLMRSRTGQYVAEHNYTTQDGLSGMFVNQLVPGRDGHVWVLPYNGGGINRINMSTREITRVDTGDIPGSESLNYLICDSAGVIWAGFRDGVMRFAPGAGQPEVIPTGRFGANEVLSMIEVQQDIWVSTTDGIRIINKETREIRRLNIMNKTFTCQYYNPDDRSVYLGTADGFVITSPGIARTDVPHRPVIITALYVNNQPAGPDAGRESIRHTRRLTLSHRQNNLSFDVSDLPYSLEEKNRFVYRLNPVDRDWQLLKQNTNRITYNNLTYGDYTLRAGKLDADGKPSEEYCTLDIHITPPWYYTRWAKTVYLLMAVSLILWTINFFRVKNRLKFERLEKERILEQSQSKIDFFTNISHDLKTPLSMIIAPVSKLLLAKGNTAEKKILETVQRNAMKLNSLIHQVLDFNRVENHANALLILSRVEFVSFAKSLFTVYGEGAAKEKPVLFSFESSLPELYMDIDVVKFDSILNNLLSNAFKHTPEGGGITLAIAPGEAADTLEIRVSDTGTGIPPQDIPYIFQRFFQSPASQGKREGTGIGLYLVKTYLELHGGSIQVRSEEGGGTSFILTLPLQAGEAGGNTAPDREADAGTDSAGPLILIVDDNREIAEFIQEILQPGYRCRIAENGKTGVEYGRELRPDLIIADVMMPVMNGLEMCRQIRKDMPTSTTPIILLTAKNDKATELESIHLNIDAFIAKPFEPDILRSRIDQLLKSKRQMEAKARIEAIAAPKAIEAVSYNEKFLSGITQIIEDHVADPDLNVNELCKLSGINSKQIYRKTKQLTGMSPVEYIKSIRMKKAAMLLNQKKFTVAEVMYMVGFSNHSYFSKCYQAAFGKTPRA